MPHSHEVPQAVVCIVCITVIYAVMWTLSVQKLKQKTETSLLKRIITLYFCFEFVGFFVFPYRSISELFIDTQGKSYQYICIILRSVSAVSSVSLASLTIIYVQLLSLVLCTRISYQAVQIWIPIIGVVYSVAFFLLFNLRSFLHANVSQLACSCVEEGLITIPYITSVVLYVIQLRKYREKRRVLFYEYTYSQMYDIEQISSTRGATGFIIARLVPIVTQWVWNVVWIQFFDDDSNAAHWIAAGITVFNAVFNAAPFLTL